MATKTLAKKAEKKLSKNELVEKVLGLLDQYVDTTGAILEDYVADEGMVTELGAADAKLRDEIENLQVEDEAGFKVLLQKLKELDKEEIDHEELLDLIDEEAIKDRAAEKGFVFIKVDNLIQQEKLEDFVTREIWPEYNQQRVNLSF